MTNKQKKIPMRMCVGCRQMKPKRELIRVVCTAEGQLSVDEKGKAPGRGAYICKDRECFRRARKSGALQKTFERSIPDDIYEAVEIQIERFELKL